KRITLPSETVIWQPEFTDKTLSRKTEAVHIDNLPDGLETIIGERGSVLSTGERQRINIARALNKKCPLIIFDEATSSVDTLSEAKIIDHLIHYRRESTVLVVSHRIATLRNFDRIVLLDRGRIVDMGRLDELLKRNTLCRDLLRTMECDENRDTIN
ncbi:ATP-binding cassette domain-containing protein, partial [Martelella alba]